MWTDDGAQVQTTSISEARVGAFGTVCPECQIPFGLMIFSNGRGSIHGLTQEGTDTARVDAAMTGLRVVTVPPNPAAPARFENVPLLVAEQFIFIQEDASRKRNPAGIMHGARSCLDVALKTLGQTEGGRRERINNLAQQGVITTAIAAWAQNLWEEGSDASHDLQADMGRAIEHVEFLKLFFEVAFELPSKIARQPHAPSPRRES